MMNHPVSCMGVAGRDVWVAGRDTVSVVGETHCLKFSGKTMLYRDILKVMLVLRKKFG